MSARADEVLILTDDECPPCSALKARLQGEPKVRFLDASSPEADRILGDQEVIFLPLAVARFGDKQRACKIGEDGEQVYLICDEDLVPLTE